MLEFECPHCKEILSIPEQFIGTTGTCRKCRKSITIDIQNTHDPDAAQADSAARPQTLVAFHIETTGKSSRRDAIIEIAGIKININGRGIDTFWSFANPDRSIPEKISERTGITNSMVADAPLSADVVRRWFEWVGPNALLFCQHAHFNARFLCAPLYKQDLEPPAERILDVVHWARDLAIPVSQYRFRTLLEYIGYPVPEYHRALDTSKGISALVPYLARRQAGVHLATDQSGVLNRIIGKKTEVLNEEKAYEAFRDASETLEKACGDDFFDRDSYRARKLHASDTAAAPVNGDAPRRAMHDPEWYEERRRQLHEYIAERSDNGDADNSSGKWEAQAPWSDAIVNAAESEEPAKQREYCKQAVSLGAPDPWPYEQLVDFYIVVKEYDSAREVCERFFETDGWKSARWADLSMKLLRRLNKLEKRLARVS